MNTVEINNIAVKAEDIEPMAFERATQQSATAPPQPVPKSKLEAGVRYAMLAVIALSLGWLGFYVQNSINQINSEIQQIYGNIVTQGSLGPD
jgi:cell division protein FtsL